MQAIAVVVVMVTFAGCGSANDATIIDRLRTEKHLEPTTISGLYN